MQFKTLIVSSLLLGLFIISLMSAAINLSDEYGTNSSILKNTAINKAFGNISAQLNDSTSDAEKQQEGLVEESSHPIITSLGFIFNSILAAGSTFMNMGVAMFNSMFSLIVESLDLNPIIVGVFLAILVIVLVLSAWRLYRAGE